MEVQKITVLRQASKPDWTLSDFQFDGIKKGVGVEDEKRDVKVKGETRIPNGIYNLALRISPKFSNEYFRDDEGNLIRAKERITPEQIARYHAPHEMIWVKDVIGFEFILWHWGNTDLDTDGCYIVGSVFGSTNGREGVINSRKKYMEIYPIVWRSLQKGTVQIEYKEAA